MQQPTVPKYILPIIILAQIAGTSLWFATNAIIDDIIDMHHFASNAVGQLTSSVQFGFIFGTLIFSFFAISDRIKPSLLFLISATFASCANLIILFSSHYTIFLLARFLVGFSLAGIYPIGMKIAANWFEGRLGKAIGFLVGALVLGTAFPHGLKAITNEIGISAVIITVSVFCFIGAILLYTLVPTGPYYKVGNRFNTNNIVQLFKISKFKKAALGYFGHMWELYAFWAFVPFLLSYYNTLFDTQLNVSLWSFIVIASGFISCGIGGIASLKIGSRKVALANIVVSALCCLLSFVMIQTPPVLFLPFLILWGMSVVGDSPQFSAMTAQASPKEMIGTALTIVTSIGFAVSIVSIELLNILKDVVPIPYLMLPLAVGPLLSIWKLQIKKGHV